MITIAAMSDRLKDFVKEPEKECGPAEAEAAALTARGCLADFIETIVPRRELRSRLDLAGYRRVCAYLYPSDDLAGEEDDLSGFATRLGDEGEPASIEVAETVRQLRAVTERMQAAVSQVLPASKIDLPDPAGLLQRRESVAWAEAVGLSMVPLMTMAVPEPDRRLSEHELLQAAVDWVADPANGAIAAAPAFASSAFLANALADYSRPEPLWPTGGTVDALAAQPRDPAPDGAVDDPASDPGAADRQSVATLPMSADLGDGPLMVADWSARAFTLEGEGVACRDARPRPVRLYFEFGSVSAALDMLARPTESRPAESRPIRHFDLVEPSAGQITMLTQLLDVWQGENRRREAEAGQKAAPSSAPSRAGGVLKGTLAVIALLLFGVFAFAMLRPQVEAAMTVHSSYAATVVETGQVLAPISGAARLAALKPGDALRPGQLLGEIRAGGTAAPVALVSPCDCRVVAILAPTGADTDTASGTPLLAYAQNRPAASLVDGIFAGSLADMLVPGRSARVTFPRTGRSVPAVVAAVVPAGAAVDHAGLVVPAHQVQGELRVTFRLAADEPAHDTGEAVDISIDHKLSDVVVGLGRLLDAGVPAWLRPRDHSPTSGQSQG